MCERFRYSQFGMAHKFVPETKLMSIDFMTGSRSNKKNKKCSASVMLSLQLINIS